MTVEISGVIPLSQNTASPAEPNSSRETGASAFILARILEGGDVGDHLNEFRSLSRETDPELFYEGLYNLGVRLEQSGHTETAARVYSTIVGAGLRPAHGPALGGPLPGIVHRAQQRLAALQGEGSVALRLEVLGRSFARQAMAPAPLVGMGVAGLAFRGMNLFAATRLANLSAGLLTRGPGLRILSGLAGFAAEVPAFTLTGRAVDRLLTGNVGARHAVPLREELASAALVLGSLKIFGAAFGQLGGRFDVGARHAVPVQQMGMLTGIMAGHGLEVAFGLREGQAPSLFLAESLVTLAQFNVAGRLSHSVFGERYEHLQQQLAMQAKAVSLRSASGGAAIPSHAEGLLRRFAPRNDSRVRRFFETVARNFQGRPLAGAAVGGNMPQFSVPAPNSELRTPNPSLPNAHSSYMVSQGEGNGSSAASPFPHLQQMESSFRNGHLIFRTGTQQACEPETLQKKLRLLQGTFTDLIFGIKSPRNFLIGPLAELLRNSQELQKGLVAHFDTFESKIQVFVEADTRLLEQVVAVDREDRPRIILLILKPEAGQAKPPATLSALYLTVGLPHSGIPRLSGMRYEFDHTQQKITSETPLPEPTFEETPLSQLLMEGIFTTIPPQGPFPWKPKKSIPPPIPFAAPPPAPQDPPPRDPPPTRPASTARQKARAAAISRIQREKVKKIPPPRDWPRADELLTYLENIGRREPPPPVSEPVSESVSEPVSPNRSQALTASLASFRSLKDEVTQTPRVITRCLSTLITELPRIPKYELPLLAAELKNDLGPLFWAPGRAEGFLKNLIVRMDRRKRLGLTQGVADFLGDSRPEVQATAFSILRDTVRHLGSDDLRSLGKYVDQKFSGKIRYHSTSMVQQARYVIEGELQQRGFSQK